MLTLDKKGRQEVLDNDWMKEEVGVKRSRAMMLKINGYHILSLSL